MNTYKFTGYITKDYEVKLSPHNGLYYAENMECDFMRDITGDELPDEAKSFFLNHVYIKDGELYANATIKHTFEEDAQGDDRDDAEDRLLTDGDCMWKINRDHKKKALIEIDFIERL